MYFLMRALALSLKNDLFYTMTIRLICLEGNVASGKSSALAHLKTQFPDIVFLAEPVDKWTSVPDAKSSHNLLDAFYKDLSKYGFCFQTYAFLSRMRELVYVLESMRLSGQKVIVCERSVFTDRLVFLETLYKTPVGSDSLRSATGIVTDIERAVYHQLWDFWIGLMRPFFSDVTIEFLFVTCQPEKALEHLRTRSRTEEACVELDYLRQLEARHREVYVNVCPELTELVSGVGRMNGVTVIENKGSRAEYFEALTKLFSESFELCEKLSERSESFELCEKLSERSESFELCEKLSERSER
jgi:deoxyadenosine/deoxycytidine kinase